MFISNTNNGDGASGKGFSASFAFGKKESVHFVIEW